jgi:hypothetical protein
MSNIAAPSPNDTKKTTFSIVIELLWNGVYLLLGAFVISLLLKPLIEWIKPDLLKSLYFSQNDILLWNLYGVLVAFPAGVLLFICVAFLSKNGNGCAIISFCIGVTSFIMLLLLGIANIVVMLHCQLTSVYASLVCIAIIFIICPFLGAYIFIVSLMGFGSSPAR